MDFTTALGHLGSAMIQGLGKKWDAFMGLEIPGKVLIVLAILFVLWVGYKFFFSLAGNYRALRNDDLRHGIRDALVRTYLGRWGLKQYRKIKKFKKGAAALLEIHLGLEPTDTADFYAEAAMLLRPTEILKGLQKIADGKYNALVYLYTKFLDGPFTTFRERIKHDLKAVEVELADNDKIQLFIVKSIKNMVLQINKEGLAVTCLSPDPELVLRITAENGKVCDYFLPTMGRIYAGEYGETTEIHLPAKAVNLSVRCKYDDLDTDFKIGRKEFIAVCEHYGVDRNLVFDYFADPGTAIFIFEDVPEDPTVAAAAPTDPIVVDDNLGVRIDDGKYMRFVFPHDEPEEAMRKKKTSASTVAPAPAATSSSGTT